MAIYASVAELHDRIGLSDTSADGTLAVFCEACSRWVDSYCSMVVNGFAQSASQTRAYSSSSLSPSEGGRLLHLDMGLLADSLPITITNGNGVVVGSGEFRLEPVGAERAWEIRLLANSGKGWVWDGDGLVLVNGRWGYSLTCPAPVKEATLMLCVRMFKRYQGAMQDVIGNADLGQLLYMKDVPGEVVALLQPYRFFTGLR